MATTFKFGHYAGAVVIGMGGGFSLGCVGWGGGQIVIPSLTHPIMGLSQISASGTSLTSLTVASITSASKYLEADAADLRIAACIALPSMLGVRLGLRLAKNSSSEFQALIFNGMSTILIPTHFFVQQWRYDLEEKKKHHENTILHPEKTVLGQPNITDIEFRLSALHCSYGIFSGVLSAVMGVGGLPLTMSYLTLSTDLPHHLIQGTAMSACLPSVIVSALTHAMVGNTPLGIAACVAAGSMIGSTFGAKAALSMTEVCWL